MKLILFISIGVGLVGCKKSPYQEPPVAAPKGVATAPAIGGSGLAVALTKAGLSCDAPGCPAGVGVVAIEGDSGVTTCTGVVVGPRTLLTSPRCLPPTIARRNADCYGEIAFALNDHGKTRAVECGRVVDFNEPGRPEYVTLELASSVDQYLAPSRAGVPDDQALSAWTVRRSNDTFVVSEQTCRSSANGSVQPSTLALGCAFRGAEAGAPIVSARGEVLALTQASEDKDSTMNFAHARLTNLACVSDPVSGAPPRRECGDAAVRCGLRTKLSDDAIAAEMTKINGGLAKVLSYKLTYDERFARIIVEPTCVHSQKTRPQGYATGERRIDAVYPGFNDLTPKLLLGEENRPRLGFQNVTGQRHLQLFANMLYGFSGWISHVDAQTQRENFLEIELPTCRKDVPDTHVFRTLQGEELTFEQWRRWPRNAGSCNG